MVFGGINHWQHLKAFIQSCKCELLEHIPSYMGWDGKDASLWSLCFCWTLLKEAQWSGMFEVVNLEGESLDLVSLNCTRDQRPTHHLLCCHTWGLPSFPSGSFWDSGCLSNWVFWEGRRHFVHLGMLLRPDRESLVCP